MHLRHPKGVVDLNKALGDNKNCNITAFVKIIVPLESHSNKCKSCMCLEQIMINRRM